MNFLNLPDKKGASNFTVIFLEQNVAQFNRINILVPADKKVKHLTQFLSALKNNPFKSFFLTNKIKEKPQFTIDKDLRELKDECKRDKDGNYVLLCYEQKKIKGDQTSITSMQDVVSVKQSTAVSAETKKKEQDGGCIAM